MKLEHFESTKHEKIARFAIEKKNRLPSYRDKD